MFKMNKREEIQNQALEIAKNHRRCGLAISMGVGKTLIGLKYIDYLNDLNMGKLNVLIAAPKVSIFDSWQADAEKFSIALDPDHVKFTTYLSLNKHNPSDYDLLILDECHSLLDTHRAFLGMFTGRILGLTGTPPRYERSEKGQIVAEYCPMLYHYITDDAVDDQILNDYQICVHMLELSDSNTFKVETKSRTFYTSERKNYQYWTKRIMQAETKKQEQIASVMRMRAMMDYVTKEDYTRNLMGTMTEKTIVFCNTQEQSDRICKYSYHSSNPDSEENLEQFRKGKINQLSCVLQLNEGVNIKNLKAGIIMHAYGNERKSSQRIGRLLRLNPDDTAEIHILCYNDTVDVKWVREALKDFDPKKIKYVTVEDQEDTDNDSAFYGQIH